MICQYKYKWLSDFIQFALIQNWTKDFQRNRQKSSVKLSKSEFTMPNKLQKQNWQLEKTVDAQMISLK